MWDYNQSKGDLGSVPVNQPLGMGWPRDAPQPSDAIGLTALSILVPPIGIALNVEGCLKGSVIDCGATALSVFGASRAARAGAATTSVGALEDASSAAFKAADDIDGFTVGNKHLPGAAGKWNKFQAGVDPKAVIEEALRSPNAHFLPMPHRIASRLSSTWASKSARRPAKRVFAS
jgi:hypothetical protein